MVTVLMLGGHSQQPAASMLGARAAVHLTCVGGVRAVFVLLVPLLIQPAAAETMSVIEAATTDLEPAEHAWTVVDLSAFQCVATTLHVFLRALLFALT